MWDFLAAYGNWLLGGLAVALLGGAFGWYISGILRQAWLDRVAAWTRD